MSFWLLSGASPLFAPFTGTVPHLNGTNYTEWKQRVLFALGCMDLDLALREEKPAPLTDESTQEQKTHFEKWERSNRLCLLFLQGQVGQNIKGSIPEQTAASEFLKAIEEQFISSDKAKANTLMAKLSSMKYTGSGSIREHIMVMRDIAFQLNAMDVTISDSFLVHFILNSLPSEYEAFKISYNTHQAKWSPNELMTMCVQEEERLRGERNQVINFTSHKESGTSGKPNSVQKKGKKKHNKKRNGKGNEKEKKCFFCHKPGHLKKEYLKFKAWFEKKGNISSYVCYESHLVNVLNDT